ncbi:MAG: DUF4007 family protein [Verrucomicrobiaceae bacterium]|nr:MAG: DUF4007 family protein [Verrucomicrobiaceae bacterium]
MPKDEEHDRLPRNFHRTFKPERQYINALLRFSSLGGSGDYQEISAATGIPTGESSGKVPAILDYCQGMGLIRQTARSAKKHPVLTDFGRVVLLEDPFLKTGITQWLAHFNLCSPMCGADVWYNVFFRGQHHLGTSFQRTDLENYLKAVYETDKASLIGPLLEMYKDDASFKICGALEDGATIRRKPAPVTEEYSIAYGAWLLHLMELHFPGQNQVLVTELDAKGGSRSISGWDVSMHQRVLTLVERKGLLEIDRQMQPWLIKAKKPAASVWKNIYDELI